MNSIQIQNVSFYYQPEALVLKELQLSFDHRTTAIIGQNGAGKTTFVKLLKGLLKPSQGSIVINGMDTTSMTAATLAPHIGLVFQNPNDQIFKSKVMDEVMFGPLCIGKSVEEARTLATEALKTVGILHHAEENPYDLSLSERKMVSIASIIAMDPPILILDEPTIGQDYEGKERIKQLIAGLKAQGKLVIAILHDMDFVAQTFERTIVFSKGQVLLDDETPLVFAQEGLLKDNYLELPHVTEVAKHLGLSKTYLEVDDLIYTVGSTLPLLKEISALEVCNCHICQKT